MLSDLKSLRTVRHMNMLVVALFLLLRKTSLTHQAPPFKNVLLKAWRTGRQCFLLASVSQKRKKKMEFQIQMDALIQSKDFSLF